MSRSTSTKSKELSPVNPNSVIAEVYRSLKANIQYVAGENTKVVAITSAHKAEGRTTTITNLAISYASDGKKVLLIDADLKSSCLQDVFSLPNTIGLKDFFSNRYSSKEIVRETGMNNLSVITSGLSSNTPSVLIGSEKLKELFNELRESYDLILIDTPPLLECSDGIVISALSDGIVIVVNAQKSDKRDVQKAKANLELVNAKILGVVFNKASRK